MCVHMRGEGCSERAHPLSLLELNAGTSRQIKAMKARLTARLKGDMTEAPVG